MTEADWYAATDANVLARTLVNQRKHRLSERKFRLIACAACRSIWPEMTDELARDAVVVVERFADNPGTADDVRVADEAIYARTIGEVTPLATFAAHMATWGPWRKRGSLGGTVSCAVGYSKRVPGADGSSFPTFVLA